ncbi:hypothetical protein ACFPIJ_54015 [Dactylosporangium cerinum]|uniref:Uncharacterized protein n=1 Tax=Dactylosporangium cerinum TaxID=1434730 RepID=A0ABV9WGE9_9ACTN
MVDAEALAWSREVLGEPGPYVRETLPNLLVATHGRYVAYQQQSGLADASPYGLIWLGMPKAVVDGLSGVAGVQRHRPKRGRYFLPVVSGVPIIPWRYARDGKTDLKTVPFGKPVSDTRRSLFEPPSLPAELPLGEIGLGDAVIAELPEEQQQQFNEYGADIRALATTGGLVAVLAFASNPDALLNAHFGYARLGPGDLLDWAYCEPIELSSVDTAFVRDTTTRDDGPTFDSGPLERPKLRPRSPLESGSPGDDSTPPGPTGTHE